MTPIKRWSGAFAPPIYSMERQVCRGTLYEVPPGRRSLLVEKTNALAVPYFIALPRLYFLILDVPPHPLLFALTGEPDWKPRTSLLYHFPWPNRLSYGNICLGEYPTTHTRLLEAFFENAFVGNLNTPVRFGGEYVSTWDHWQALTREDRRCGEKLHLERWEYYEQWGKPFAIVPRRPRLFPGRLVRYRGHDYQVLEALLPRTKGDPMTYLLENSRTKKRLYRRDTPEIQRA